MEPQGTKLEPQGAQKKANLGPDGKTNSLESRVALSGVLGDLFVAELGGPPKSRDTPKVTKHVGIRTRTRFGHFLYFPKKGALSNSSSV